VCGRVIPKFLFFARQWAILVTNAHTLCGVAVLREQFCFVFWRTTKMQLINLEFWPVDFPKSNPSVLLRSRSFLISWAHGCAHCYFRTLHGSLKCCIPLTLPQHTPTDCRFLRRETYFAHKDEIIPRTFSRGQVSCVFAIGHNLPTNKHLRDFTLSVACYPH
jgi:hypothetical protein